MYNLRQKNNNNKKKDTLSRYKVNFPLSRHNTANSLYSCLGFTVVIESESERYSLRSLNLRPSSRKLQSPVSKCLFGRLLELGCLHDGKRDPKHCGPFSSIQRNDRKE